MITADAYIYLPPPPSLLPTPRHAVVAECMQEEADTGVGAFLSN